MHELIELEIKDSVVFVFVYYTIQPVVTGYEQYHDELVVERVKLLPFEEYQKIYGHDYTIEEHTELESVPQKELIKIAQEKLRP